MDTDGRDAGTAHAPTAITPRRPGLPPPGPAPRPFGLPPDDFDRDPIASLNRLRSEYGDVFAFAAGKVLVARPAWVHWTLARTNRDTRVDAPPLPPRLQRRPLIRGRVERWMAARRTAQWHRLGRDIAERTAPLIRGHLGDFLDAAGDRPVRLPDCERAALLAADRVFVHDMDDGLRARLFPAARLMLDEGAATVTLPPWMSLRTRRRLHANDLWIDALTARVARRRAERREDDPALDMLDLLADARDDGGPVFDDLEIAQTLSINLGNLYAVGGSGLGWLLAAHAAHGPVRPAGTDRAAWASAVVKETLRLYPAVSLTSRNLVEDAGFGDVTVPAGTSVFVSPLMLHTDTRWWRDDPARFDPARWLGDDVHDPHAYIPYGSGPRVCTGVHIANAVLEHAADLLADRTVAGRPGPPLREWSAITRPRRLRVTVTPNA
ncbi:cytochrome P450 [Glycomyces sp. NPDC047369]